MRKGNQNTERTRLINKILRGLAVAACAVVILALTSCGTADDGSAGSDDASSAAATNAPAENSALSEADIEAGTLVRAAKKEESVSVRTNADGTPTEVKVSVHLEGVPEGDFIEDVSTLSGIRNREGDEEFLQNGTALYWENHGGDIRYEGISDAELPFDVRIRYFLDGEEVAPESLSGKSGEVKIRFEYENRAKQTVPVGEENIEMAVPVTAISLAILPEDIFSDVAVTNGRLIKFGGETIALGIAMPGLAESLRLADTELTESLDLPEYVEITAQAKKCTLDFTATILSPGLLAGLGDDENVTGEDSKADDKKSIDDLFDSTKELGDASKELVTGTGELYNGAKELGDGLNAYVDGASQLADGAASLTDGVSQLQAQSPQLTSGASQLADGLSQLSAGLAQIDSAQLNQLSQLDLSGLTSALAGVDLSGLESMIRNTLGDAAAAPIASLAASLSSLQANAGALASLPAMAGQLSQSVSELQTGISQLSAGASALSEGVTAYTGGVDQIAGGAAQLSTGASQLAASGASLTEGYAELFNGIGELRDGVAKFDQEGISELTRVLGEELKGLVDRYRAVKDLGTSYNNFSGILDGQEGEVRFIFESEGV